MENESEESDFAEKFRGIMLSSALDIDAIGLSTFGKKLGIRH